MNITRVVDHEEADPEFLNVAGMAGRVIVHETKRLNEEHGSDFRSPIIHHEQGYVEVGDKKLKICLVSGDDTKNKRTLDI